MLFAKRNADDRHAQQKTEDDVTDPCPQTTENEPEQIERNADATWRTIGLLDLGTERPQAEQADLKRLQRNRNADDGETHGNAAREITNGCFQAAEYPPKDVTKKFHKSYLLI